MVWAGGGYGPPMGGGGPAGRPGQGLPFAGIPSELQAGVDRLLDEEPDHGEPRVRFSHGRTAVELRRLSLWRLLGQHKALVAAAVLLVMVLSLVAQAGPVLTEYAINDGMRPGHGDFGLVAALAGAYALTLLVTILAQQGRGKVAGRIAARVMNRLRVSVFTHLQRLSLDYYEREMAGRIMTRMTTDVDQFENLMENGLLSALVAMVTFVGVGVALVVIDPLLGLCTLSVVLPLAAATVTFRRRAAVLYDQARERIAVVNADFQESLSGVRESQSFVHEAATRERFHRLGADYVETRVRAQRLVATYFPFIQFLSGLADAIVLGVGAVLVTSGHLTAGALIAFVLYVDMFFSPIQSLSQVFDSWQQTRVSIGRISELMQIETRTPDPAHPLAAGRLDGRPPGFISELCEAAPCGARLDDS